MLLSDAINWPALTGGEPNKLDLGLVSCLCLVRGNARHLARALSCYDAQTYQNRELVCVYADIDSGCESIIASRPDVTWMRIGPGENIGARRNLSLDVAHGEWFAIWDDDDYSAPSRLTITLSEMRHFGKRAAVLTRELMFDETTQRGYFARVRPWEHTLICRRELPYRPRWKSEAQRGEDSRLVAELLPHQIEYPEQYVYTWHGQNVWSKPHWEALRGKECSTGDSARLADLLK